MQGRPAVGRAVRRGEMGAMMAKETWVRREYEVGNETMMPRTNETERERKKRGQSSPGRRTPLAALSS